ncbi:MAG: C45 family autoproteolytic acyltransferase/hydrolase [Pseudomonadota bacterium]|nr:C45 family autoproteolytic acyltransferase/hydrolase [Pseudomonadota bacterium]
MVFQAIAEDAPGPKWQAVFNRHWPAYQRWFLSQGNSARPYYLTGLRMLQTHMPELVPTYERLVALAGGGDLAARFLSLYCPPPYLIGCSQAVWTTAQYPPLLVRNYDYNPRLLEGVIWKSAWNGRAVMGTSDCLWGLVDGMNDAGLAVSLTFGGRQVIGEGFGVPLILRYVLEFCTTTAEAVAVLQRLPTHMAYNVTAVDRSGQYQTVYLAPDRPAVVRRTPIATNHQQAIEWHQHAQATATVERERYLLFRLRGSSETPDRLVQAFLHSPLYSTAYARGYGTLYTAVYRPQSGEAEYLWPNCVWRQSFADFREEARQVHYPHAPEAMQRLH